MADFFVSYTSADHKWAERIAYIVEEEDFEVIIQAIKGRLSPPGPAIPEIMISGVSKALLSKCGRSIIIAATDECARVY